MKKPGRISSNIRLHLYKLRAGRSVNDSIYVNGKIKNHLESLKNPPRTEIINYLLSILNRSTKYLEIGVRNPEGNFNHIKADEKYSVDPGIEYIDNPVDFKLTSDSFFEKLGRNEILSNIIKFDVIFIDGLHLAEQVNRDILNALKYIKTDGFIVLHDCNPPTEWHTRENHSYSKTPAGSFWNGTTWKAFIKWRGNPSINSCCIDTNWGIGILSKNQPIGRSIEKVNEFYEFDLLDRHRQEFLNLMNFEDFKTMLGK